MSIVKIVIDEKKIESIIFNYTKKILSKDSKSYNIPPPIYSIVEEIKHTLGQEYSTIVSESKIVDNTREETLHFIESQGLKDSIAARSVFNYVFNNKGRYAEPFSYGTPVIGYAKDDKEFRGWYSHQEGEEFVMLVYRPTNFMLAEGVYKEIKCKICIIDSTYEEL